VIGIVEKIVAPFLQNAPSPWFQAGALTLSLPLPPRQCQLQGGINLRSPAAGRKGYEKI
jgi:hypothetical protein